LVFQFQTFELLQVLFVLGYGSRRRIWKVDHLATTSTRLYDCLYRCRSLSSFFELFTMKFAQELVELLCFTLVIIPMLLSAYRIPDLCCWVLLSWLSWLVCKKVMIVHGRWYLLGTHELIFTLVT
jgi:hypothetical protein